MEHIQTWQNSDSLLTFIFSFKNTDLIDYFLPHFLSTNSVRLVSPIYVIEPEQMWKITMRAKLQVNQDSVFIFCNHITIVHKSYEDVQENEDKG